MCDRYSGCDRDYFEGYDAALRDVKAILVAPGFVLVAEQLEKIEEFVARGLKEEGVHDGG